MLQKNQVVELVVDAVSHEGNGIARHEGMAVFIPRTAVGDRLRAQIVQVRKQYAYAILVELLEPSKHRITDDCPVYRHCGGCSLRQMTYEQEMEIKVGWVKDNLQRIGGIDAPMDSPIASPQNQRYRNKAQFPVRRVEGRLCAGFFSRRSHRLVPVDDCLLQPVFFTDICRAVLTWMEEKGVDAYDEDTHTGTVRHIYIRYAEVTGQVMVCLVINAQRLPGTGCLIGALQAACPGLETVVLSHNQRRTNVVTGERMTVLLGDGRVRDQIAGVEVALSPLSFYQVNRPAAELLYAAALDYAAPTGDDLLLDLYCGAGTIGLSMAHQAGRVIGVEVVEDAVQNAKENAKRMKAENTEFFCGDAAQAAQALQAWGEKPQIVLLDPPRKGAEEELLCCIAGMQPQRIVYISCNSATLARDCARLRELGYRVKRWRAADLFPRTAHMESVVLLEKMNL